MSGLSSSLNKMDISGANASDNITIICKEDSWEVDGALLCNASKMIARMMKSGMKEAQTRRIEQNEFDVETLKCMVSFVQHKAYTIEEEADLANDHEKSDAQPYIPPPVINDVLLAHVEMFKIADYYEMDELENYVVKKIEEVGIHGWHPDGFVDVVEKVSDVSRPRRNGKSLCDALCAYTLQHRARVMRDLTMMIIFRNHPKVQTFVADLFRATVQQSIRDQSSHDRIMRKQREAQQDFERKIAGRDAEISYEPYVTKALVDAIPTLPRSCRGVGCTAEFPSNLSLERDMIVYTSKRGLLDHQLLSLWATGEKV